jgi:hypothetical protein
MMRFRPAKEPERFDERCRGRGRKWLAEHSSWDRPYDYWSEFEPDLRAAFHDLCAYCTMVIPKGDVDHFIPVALLKRRGHHHRIYEWDNLRYADEYFNKKKTDFLILDPFQVRDDWFDLLLPSLELVLTDRLPKRHHTRARRTLEKLGLDRGEVVVRYRRKWFNMYRRRRLDLDGLREVAPLIARAVTRDLARNLDWQQIPLPPGAD